MHTNYSDVDDCVSMTSYDTDTDTLGSRRKMPALQPRSPFMKYFKPRQRSAGDYSQFNGIVRGLYHKGGGAPGESTCTYIMCTCVRIDECT